MHKSACRAETISFMKTQDFLDSNEFSEQQILDMMNLGVTLKACVRADYFPPLLRRRIVALLPTGDASLLDIMCHTAVSQLGGTLITAPLTLAAPEKLREDAMLLDRCCDLVIARSERHETLLALAKYADVPIVNAGSAHSLPVQEIADLITMFEHLPREKKLEDCKAVFYGANCPACASVLYATTKIGMQFTQITPEKSGELTPPQLKNAERNVKKSGGTYAVSNNPAEAFRGADFLFMDAPLSQKLPPDAESGILRIDPTENRVAALRSILVCMLYTNPAARDTLLVEKMKRMLAIKLQAIFGFGEANE